jgi:hypothetical protein
MTPRRFAETCVELINRGGYDQLGELFAEDARFLAPGQREFLGRAQITEFYKQFLADITPQVRIATYVEQGNDCVFELEATTRDRPDFRLGAIDHATLDANGFVSRFAVHTK